MKREPCSMKSAAKHHNKGISKSIFPKEIIAADRAGMRVRICTPKRLQDRPKLVRPISKAKAGLLKLKDWYKSKDNTNNHNPNHFDEEQDKDNINNHNNNHFDEEQDKDDWNQTEEQADQPQHHRQAKHLDKYNQIDTLPTLGTSREQEIQSRETLEEEQDARDKEEQATVLGEHSEPGRRSGSRTQEQELDRRSGSGTEAQEPRLLDEQREGDKRGTGGDDRDGNVSKSRSRREWANLGLCSQSASKFKGSKPKRFKGKAKPCL